MAKSISLFYLVAGALQIMGAASTTITTPYPASLTVDDDDLKANSLANIYLDYGNRDIQGTLTLTFGDCVDDLDTPYTTFIGSTDISDKFKPTKFVWATPGYTKSGCIFAIDDEGKVFAKSERYTISSKMSKRGLPEFDNMHFDAVNFHKTQTSNHGNMIAASDKSESKYYYLYA
ncbi:hypothetical protein O0I10_011362 [Lichtheimia ornata]|uniref:Uncharacterized protein n=1 Tax=Lichtheimia ornata TaxID=688661 RepID=A0AAD7UTV4_9FUNG|nr:uncharacterized protein O0I10_011362 [Lichtheimia ornata]KAJ8652981.1 hypothetical protein O0I10_011362 [Lichtheimia ornata]